MYSIRLSSAVSFSFKVAKRDLQDISKEKKTLFTFSSQLFQLSMFGNRKSIIFLDTKIRTKHKHNDVININVYKLLSCVHWCVHVLK